MIVQNIINAGRGLWTFTKEAISFVVLLGSVSIIVVTIAAFIGR